VDGALGVVLVGDGRAEQRHDAVAEELVDRALEAVNLGEHQLPSRVVRAVLGKGGRVAGERPRWNLP
jgi:hypothetical protein